MVFVVLPSCSTTTCWQRKGYRPSSSVVVVLCCRTVPDKEGKQQEEEEGEECLGIYGDNKSQENGQTN